MFGRYLADICIFIRDWHSSNWISASMKGDSPKVFHTRISVI